MGYQPFESPFTYLNGTKNSMGMAIYKALFHSLHGVRSIGGLCRLRVTSGPPHEKSYVDLIDRCQLAVGPELPRIYALNPTEGVKITSFIAPPVGKYLTKHL